MRTRADCEWVTECVRRVRSERRIVCVGLCGQSALNVWKHETVALADLKTHPQVETPKHPTYFFFISFVVAFRRMYSSNIREQWCSHHGSDIYICLICPTKMCVDILSVQKPRIFTVSIIKSWINFVMCLGRNSPDGVVGVVVDCVLRNTYVNSYGYFSNLFQSGNFCIFNFCKELAHTN